MANNPLARAVLITWRRNNTYAQRLVEDLPVGAMLAQPPGLPAVMNHPAWILAHLNLYAGLAVRLARGEPFDDPAEHRYGMKSRPLADAAAYPGKAELVGEWRRWHEEGETALLGVSEAVTGSPTPLARWGAAHPTVGDMLVALMVKHESGHLGQLSAWRRAMGHPSVAM